MQTVTYPERLRRASGRAGLAAAHVAVLAGVLVAAPPLQAQQMPPGYSGASLTLNLFVERADGSNAGAGSGVSPCETLIYTGSLTGGSASACCYRGGTPRITTPRRCASDADCTDNPGGKCGTETTCGTEIAGRCSYNVTPPGGLPDKCPGDPPSETLSVQYQVRD